MPTKLLACHVQKAVANKHTVTRMSLSSKMRFPIFVALCITAISLSFAFAFDSEKKNINFLDYPAGIERKQAFFNYLNPIIEEVNRSLLEHRNKVIFLSQKSQLNIRDRRWLKHINEQYNAYVFDEHNQKHWSALLDKIDIIPAALVLAQSAKESGWGTSRFAREGNNFFGQWCYNAGCGMVPEKRDRDANHEVAKYKSMKESVASYIKNLNSHPAYKDLRKIRKHLRKTKKAITGYHLATGLKHYSERGQLYVKEVQTLIRNNKLDGYTESI